MWKKKTCPFVEEKPWPFVENQHPVFETDPYEAMKDAHAVAVITEWDEFATYDRKKIYGVMKKPAFVFDGRNILDLK